MSKKPPKVEDPPAPYTAKKPAKKAVPKKADPGEVEFKRIANKLFTERKELLHKLAQ